MFIFWVVRGLKGQTIAQNEKQHYIHHVPFLKNSIAYKQGKKWPKMTKKIMSIAVDISGIIYHMIVIYGTLV